MKRFVLHELVMMSLREKKARRVKFDRSLTVIRGANDTGKSSLIKTIYSTFGAEVPHVHPKWKDAEVRSAVTFSIDKRSYRILRNEGRYTLFDANDKKMQSFDSVTNELAPYFAELFNFHLSLATRDEEKQATPAFLFLPFYVDQDAGWTSNWNSFDRLGQFRNWRTDVVHFHVGIRPSEYYVAKSALASVQNSIDELIARRQQLDKLLLDLEKKLHAGHFDIDVEAYKEEIERLLIECNKLKAEEDTLKSTLIDIYNSKHAIESQINITKEVAAELGKDFRFANDNLNDSVECPTCGTVYENAFAERFGIAQDENRCRELLLELQSESHAIDARLKELKLEVDRLREQSSSITALLEEKRGDVRLRDVLESAGKKEVRQILQSDFDQMNLQIGALEIEADKFRRRMKELGDRKKAGEIRSKYLSLMRQHLLALSVLNFEEKSYKRMDATINESGSDLPRALLAYYFSILKTISIFSTSSYCPIVIDSPRQQDQDEPNYKRMMEFIRDNQPEASQLVLGVVDTAGVKFGGTSVRLTRKYSVLSQEDFEEIAAELAPLLDASLSK